MHPLEKPQAFNEVLSHISNGGTLDEIATLWSVKWRDLWAWIQDHPGRLDLYKTALATRSEVLKDKVLCQVLAIASLDPRRAYDQDGKLLPVKDWPADVAAALAGFDGKLLNKLDALKLLGKELGMFRDRVEVSGEVKLGDLLKESYEKTVGENQTAPPAPEVEDLRDA